MTRQAPAAALLAVVVGGCGWLAPSAGGPFIPLSKVTVENGTDADLLVRMNWPDGYIQVERVSASSTQYLSGAIGTSGFPRTIDVLDAGCRLLASVPGLAPGRAGLVVINELRTWIEPVEVAAEQWTIAEPVDECGATEVDPAPADGP